MTKKAPDFKLLDQDGTIKKLSDYKGRWLVVYFYPKDNSPGCTKEACSFRDEHSVIAQFGNAEIVGINKASVSSHKRFASKHRIKFSLLSDPTLEVTKSYGALKSGRARLLDRPFVTRRNTYLINAKGEIVKEYLGVNPKNHAYQIIKDLQEFQKIVRA